MEFFSPPFRSKTVESKLEQDNLGHQLLKKMGEGLLLRNKCMAFLNEHCLQISSVLQLASFDVRY